MKPRLLFLTVLPLALLAGCGSVTPRTDLLGDPAPTAGAMRSVTITPNTRWVNVTGGETVNFVVDDKSFAWSFNVSQTVSSFALNQIAPPGLLGREVRVYVDPDPRYSERSDRHSQLPY
jgi:uncharacterized protein YceK